MEIQLPMAINSIFHKDYNKTCTTHSKSNNIEIMIGNETNETIKELFHSLLQIYQKDLEEPMKGSEFVVASVDLLHYKCHKISLNGSASYINSSKCLKK